MKRFYKHASVTEQDGGFQVMLDGRSVKTVKNAPQIAPTRALADALADEWSRQGEKIDPASFRFRDLTDYAIDIVAPDPGETIAKLLGFAETDTLCYRADPEDALFARQQRDWEPLVTAVEAREGVTLHRISGIMHKPQPEASLARLKARLEAFDPFTLAGLFTLASLSASLCIALEALKDGADPQNLWRAASLEEEWQADLWGRDHLAEERRAKRGDEFRNAHEWLQLVRG